MQTNRALALFLALSLARPLFAAAPAEPLPRSSPEAQGVSSSGILSFIDEADHAIDSLHSVMILRHGRVIAEGWWSPYNRDTAHELYSLSKSFTSTAVGLAVSEGRISLDDTVLSFFPEDAPAKPSDNLKAMRIRDLLRMNAGHQVELPAAREQMTTAAFLAHPVPFKPGTRFLYNTPATFMLSAIVQKATGQKVVDYLQTRLFDPIGIERPAWNTNVQGICLGGTGLSVHTEDIARFGQLYLQKGNWNGKQIVPEKWVAEATSLQTSNGSNPKSDWDQGYGYQFWRCRHGAFRGDGAYGQYCLVLPGQDAVVAITSGVKDMQAVLDLVWNKLLPSMRDEALPPAPEDQKKLSDHLAGLSLRRVSGDASNATAKRVACKKYAFASNSQHLEAVTVGQGAGDETTLTLRLNGQDDKLSPASNEWIKGKLRYGNFPERTVAASGAWTSDDTFTVKICFYETPFTLQMRLRFSGDQVFCDQEWNVFSGATKLPQLTGQAK